MKMLITILGVLVFSINPASADSKCKKVKIKIGNYNKTLTRKITKIYSYDYTE